MDYFKNTEFISNSQLRSFVKYDKWGNRILTPDIYKALYIDKTQEFEVNDAIIVWKIVDRYFDWEWEKVWDSYEIKARRSASDKETQTIISPAMQETALKMISWGNNWSKFQEFINDKNTKAQVRKEIESDFTDENWEVFNIKIKGLPDYVNEDRKLIVDLKTTWNLDMVIDDLQFKWEPKFTANYIRQLAWYNKLMWCWYDWALAVITEKWVKWIDIPNWILEKATEILDKDYIDLYKFLKNPNSINESIFIDEPLEL